MRVLIFFLCLILGQQVSSQKLTCSDFTRGTFKIKIPGSDLFVTIERDSTTQTEKVVTEDKLLIAYETIEWINECSYRMKYDSSRMELDDTQKLINAFNGIVVKHISFTNKCSAYDAILTRPDGKEIKQSLEICLEK